MIELIPRNIKVRRTDKAISNRKDTSGGFRQRHISRDVNFRIFILLVDLVNVDTTMLLKDI